jgi:prophage tail gpP-like protein
MRSHSRIIPARSRKAVHPQPGDTIYTFLERLARVRGIVLGSDHLGNMLLIDEHDYLVSANLVEGENILKMQCVISKEFTREFYMMRGQTVGNGYSGPPIYPHDDL